MPRCQDDAVGDIESVLYREALLDLLRTTRAFAHASIVAAERARRVNDDDPLAPAVAAECRAALLLAITAVPELLSLFHPETKDGLATHASDDVPAKQSPANQGR
jgi:hypothetical protein